MTHTSTEQPEPLPTAEAVMAQAQVFASAWSLFGSGSILEPENSEEVAAEAKAQLAEMVRGLHARVQELEAERDEADRRAGRAERHMAGLNDDVRLFEAARRRMKAQWGVHDNVSFDVVWQQALDAKAFQAQSVPLALYQRDTIKANAWRETATGGYWDVNDIIDATEAAHGITQEKLG